MKNIITITNINKTGDIFWLDGWEGKAQGGAYTRCNLNDCINVINERGAKIVGIKLDLKEKWNLELIIENKKEEKTQNGLSHNETHEGAKL